MLMAEAEAILLLILLLMLLLQSAAQLPTLFYRFNPPNHLRAAPWSSPAARAQTQPLLLLLAAQHSPQQNSNKKRHQRTTFKPIISTPAGRRSLQQRPIRCSAPPARLSQRLG